MSELSANQRVMNYILEEIKQNYGNERYKLPTELELADNLSVSRNSVREALKTLQNIGLIYSIKGSGYRLENNLENSLLNLIHILFDILPNQYIYKDISNIREALEIKSLLLIQNNDLSNDDINLLKQYVENMKNNINPEENDQKFHIKIAELTQNSLMEFISKVLLSRVSKNYILIPWDSINDDERKKLIESHEKIIEWLTINTPTIISSNPISEHYKVADDIINSQNKLYDNASLTKRTIKELVEMGISENEISHIIKSLRSYK